MLENETKTPEKPSENNTSTTMQSIDNQTFVDSDNGGIEDFRKVLNIPVEKPSEKTEEKTFEKEDPFGDMLGDSDEGFEDMFDPEGEGMGELFEDSEALSEMAVELLDLGMNYASQAISMDWGQDEKYSISDARKRKLRKPLSKLLEKRAPKVSPELAFLVFVVAIYSPQLIKAYGVRREKLNAQREATKPQPMKVPQNGSIGGVTPSEADEYETIIREMRSKSNEQPQTDAKPEPPKRKVGRPKGSKDTKPRKPRTTTPKATAKPKGGTAKKGAAKT